MSYPKRRPALSLVGLVGLLLLGASLSESTATVASAAEEDTPTETPIALHLTQISAIPLCNAAQKQIARKVEDVEVQREYRKPAGDSSLDWKQERPVLELDLEENPTTGFSWVVTSLPKCVCALEKSQLDVSSSDDGRRRIGAPSNHRLRLFRECAACESSLGFRSNPCVLSLMYMRQWHQPQEGYTLSIRLPQRIAQLG